MTLWPWDSVNFRDGVERLIRVCHGPGDTSTTYKIWQQGKIFVWGHTTHLLHRHTAMSSAELNCLLPLNIPFLSISKLLNIFFLRNYSDVLNEIVFYSFCNANIIFWEIFQHFKEILQPRKFPIYIRRVEDGMRWLIWIYPIYPVADRHVITQMQPRFISNLF